MEWLSQTLIFEIYICGFVLSLAAQTLPQSKFGRQSAWGVSRGWQNEIAIWNIFAVIVLYAFLKHGFRSRLAVLSLAVLSCGFGLNHLIAFRQAKRLSNLQGFLANLAGLILIFAWWTVGQ